jgi:hypothetical protein
MKILFLVFCSFSFLSLVKKEKPWEVFVTDAFEISFPDKPVLDTNLLNSDIGILKMYTYMYDASKQKRSKNKIFSLVHVAYPADLFHSNQPEQVTSIFRNTVDGAVANVQGKLLSEEITSLNNFPGRIVEIDFQDGFAVILMHCYLVENKMYIVQTITETNAYPNEMSQRFIAYFKLN